MKYFQDLILKEIVSHYSNLEVTFTTPPSIEAGHISIPCFHFSKVLKASPKDIAKRLSLLVSKLDFIDSVEVVSGYLNCFIKREILFKHVLASVRNSKEKYGSNYSGASKTVLIEHTSINPNASPHVGRARNAMIGDVIARLLKFEEYDVNVHYFVNDIGKQIAMLVLETMDKEDVSFKDLLEIYVDANKKLKHDSSYEQEVFRLLYKLENKDEDVRKCFRNLVDICIEGQVSLFNKLGIEYDIFDYESDYLFNKRLDELIDRFKQLHEFEEDEDGRYVLNLSSYDLPMKAPYFVLTRKDKTSLYPLRDIAYTMDKVNTNVDRNIIVLGEDQKLYHRQIVAALDLLGFSAPEVVHYSHVRLADGRMKTRDGSVVLLEDFMDAALQKAKEEMTKRRSVVDKDTIKAIAYGAVRYSIIKASNDKNVIFSLEDALSFEGDAGPYLQYSLARINSILENCKDVNISEIDYSLLGEKEEIELIIAIDKMSKAIELAVKDLSPNVVANYLFSLTQVFSKFYHKHSIINAQSNELKITRLHLILAVKQVIENCFMILGIDCIKSM